jgi:hypothetical protein
MSREEKLIMLITDKTATADVPDNFPETAQDKAFYAEYALQSVLSDIAPALKKIGSLNRLFAVSAKDKLPDVITYNECIKILKHLVKVKSDIDEAYKNIIDVYNSARRNVNV